MFEDTLGLTSPARFYLLAFPGGPSFSGHYYNNVSSFFMGTSYFVQLKGVVVVFVVLCVDGKKYLDLIAARQGKAR